MTPEILGYIVSVMIVLSWWLVGWAFKKPAQPAQWAQERGDDSAHRVDRLGATIPIERRTWTRFDYDDSGASDIGPGEDCEEIEKRAEEAETWAEYRRKIEEGIDREDGDAVKQAIRRYVRGYLAERRQTVARSEIKPPTSGEMAGREIG